MSGIEERVESVKGMYFSDRCQFCHELGEKVEPFLCEDCRQEIFDWVNSKGWAIHQVPQPLDKELREKWKDTVISPEKTRKAYGADTFLSTGMLNVKEAQAKATWDNALALLPNIEEARQQMVRKIKDELEKCGWFVNMGDGRWGERKLAWRNFWKRYTGQALSGKDGKEAQ